jgi:putative ABC transport system permease protein
LRLAWESISSNKLRSLLTMLGIIIGVASVIIMISISSGTEAAIEQSITGLGANLVYVNRSFTPGGARGSPGAGGGAGGLVYDDSFAIAEQVNGVAAVVVEQSSTETVKSSDTILENVTILGTTADFPSVRDMEFNAGSYFTQEQVDRKQKLVVLGYALAGSLFGDAEPMYQTVTVGTTKFTVIGVFAERGTVSGVDFDSQLYAPITIVFKYFTPSEFARFIGDAVRTIHVEVEDPEEIDRVIQQIALLLAERHDVSLESPDFTITTQQDIIQTQESTTSAFRNLLGWVAGVSLVVGGIGIMNIMLVSVTERTREIGIRQAIGATPRDILWQFLTEAVMMSLVGGVLGILAGVLGSWAFGQFSDLPTVILAPAILLAFISAAVVGIFFGWYPANAGSQMEPIEALRHE